MSDHFQASRVGHTYQYANEVMNNSINMINPDINGKKIDCAFNDAFLLRRITIFLRKSECSHTSPIIYEMHTVKHCANHGHKDLWVA